MEKLGRADGKRIVMFKPIYCDMDGVLADFNAEPDGIKRFESEIGFFARLKPIEDNLKMIRKLIADGNEVYILSASPNKRADGDKRKWLHRYLKKMPDGNMIFMRNGNVKADYRRTPDGILFDDWSKNLKDWENADGNLTSWKVEADGSIRLGIDLMIK